MIISPQMDIRWKDNQVIEFSSLRTIAQRQIRSLLRRKESTQNHLFYEEEIKKIISHERNLVKNVERGEDSA